MPQTHPLQKNFLVLPSVASTLSVALCLALLACAAPAGSPAKAEKGEIMNGTSPAAAASVRAEKGEIMNGTELVEGFDMGIDSSDHLTDWLNTGIDYMELKFPANQKWAAAFITVGQPVEPPRPSIDFSAFKYLTLEMRGAKGDEMVEIGIKSNTQPDNGRETKVTHSLTAKWETYKIELSRFKGTDLAHLYVVTEFVYNGKTAQTIYFRNIKYTTK